MAEGQIVDRTNERECPVCFMADLDYGPEAAEAWELYHDAHCDGRWGIEPDDARLVPCVTPGCNDTTGPDVSSLCTDHRSEVFG